MIDLTITATSTRYIWLPFRVVDPQDGSQVSTSGATLKAALMRGTDLPDTADWVAATADGQRSIGANVYDLARVLVGATGAIVPSPGDYTAWVQVTLSPEVAEEPCGTVRVL